MITVAKKTKNESGQSLFEFMLMLPFLVSFVLITYRVNAAIQVSINNQQYARGQALHLAGNSSVYPLRRQVAGVLIPIGHNVLMVGASDNVADATNYYPEATMRLITRASVQGGSEESHAEPQKRSQVRIRSTVAICTQANVMSDGRTPLMTNGGFYNINENLRINHCDGKELHL